MPVFVKPVIFYLLRRLIRNTSHFAVRNRTQADHPLDSLVSEFEALSGTVHSGARYLATTRPIAPLLSKAREIGEAPVESTSSGASSVVAAASLLGPAADRVVAMTGFTIRIVVKAAPTGEAITRTPWT
jgi:hypothetical protein